MTKIISIICAPPHSEFNPGMHSVDLGAFSFFLKNKFNAHVRFCLLHDPEPELKDFLYEQLPFKYELFYEKLEDLYASDLIVYWGDFLQTFSYHRDDIGPRLVRYGLAKNDDDSLEIVRRHFLLSEAPDEVLAKTIVFGSNFFINETVSFFETSYGPAIERFITKVNRIWVRDILSAITVNHLKKDYTTNFLGMDCSFLWDYGNSKVTYLPLPSKRGERSRSWWKKKEERKFKCGVFLGRMPDNVPDLLPLIDNLADRLDAKLEYIPWLWQQEVHYKVIRRGLKNIKIPSEKMNLFDIYARVKEYNFIITDTYHLCLNAWRMGIPAICIGNGNSPLYYTLTDKKKELFYNMYGASAFYIFLGDIMTHDSRLEIVEKIADQLTQNKITDLIVSTLDANKHVIEIELAKSVSSILNNNK